VIGEDTGPDASAGEVTASEVTKPSVPPEPGATPLSLFEGFGVEIEWMIVDAETLDIRPAADAVLGDDGEVDRGAMAWSNELVLHVLEAKTNGPAASLEGLAAVFHREVLEAERRLAPRGCRLLSGAAHPWMDPERETRIWPHEYTEVYRAFDRIFGVRGHGWANLQSTHLNLPFSGDADFAALHQAIRLVLPLIPALSAASPVLDGVVQPNLDERMERYRTNANRVPSVSGGVVPEPVASRRAYEEEVLGRIYRDMEPLDPSGVLRHEWVNARGAIARFDRGAIEIRVIDAQESPAMDLAVVELTVAAVRRLVDAAGHAPLDGPPTGELRALLADTVKEADRASLGGRATSAERSSRARREALAPLLDGVGIQDLRPADAGEFWAALAEASGLGGDGPMGDLIRGGPLARRLLAELGRQTGAAAAGRELQPGEVVPRGAMRACWEGVGDALRRNGAFPE
jgi:glutamate---cysteine ligase / carboxylate-amine ligase